MILGTAFQGLILRVFVTRMLASFLYLTSTLLKWISFIVLKRCSLISNLFLMQQRISNSFLCGNEKVTILCNSAIHLAVGRALYFHPKIVWGSQSQRVAPVLRLVRQSSSYLLPFLKVPCSIYYQHLWTDLTFKKATKEMFLFYSSCLLFSSEAVYLVPTWLWSPSTELNNPASFPYL